MCFFWSQKRIKHPALPIWSKYYERLFQSQTGLVCPMLTCLTRLYIVKPELGKKGESDPELADFIWNRSDALLLINHTIEHINKACLDIIKLTFGDM